MSDKRSGRRHRAVTHIEPSRGAAMAAGIFGVFLFGVLAAAAWTYPSRPWPSAWVQVPEAQPGLHIAAAIMAGFAALCLIIAVVNGRRWRLGRRLERWSNDPRLGAHMPPLESTIPAAAVMAPPLDVDVVVARKLPKPTAPARQVTTQSNVLGARPLRVAYLRRFENRARTRTFMEGAWREFGPVYMLRSAGSMTPAEYRRLMRGGSPAGLFITSRAQLMEQLHRPDRALTGKGRQALRDVGPATVRVRDRYGSFPVISLLCHGSFWKEAIDVLLTQVDLIVLDLSGLDESNQATRYEMQRVVDRVPIERVVVLVDEHSNRRWLDAQLHDAWSRMAATSPNAYGGPRRLTMAVTDRIVRSQTTTTRTGPNGTTVSSPGPVQVRLVARRNDTRRLLAITQARLSG